MAQYTNQWRLKKKRPRKHNELRNRDRRAKTKAPEFELPELIKACMAHAPLLLLGSFAVALEEPELALR
jgi:hypothetical protein